ncbi:MAG: hypothetical protein ACKVH8_13765 [Pirellulales bacterium]
MTSRPASTVSSGSWRTGRSNHRSRTKRRRLVTRRPPTTRLLLPNSLTRGKTLDKDREFADKQVWFTRSGLSSEIRVLGV